MKLHYIVALLITPVLFAQSKPDTKTVEITVKSSPAEDSLVNASKEFSTNKQKYDVMLEQARTTLEKNQKTISKKLQDAQNDLNAKLKADKKYKPMVDNIITLQNQMSDARKTIQTKFNQDSSDLQQKMTTETALIGGLIPVVRQENNLPNSATFDMNTQKWSKSK